NAVSIDQFWNQGSVDLGATEGDLYEILIEGWPAPSDIVPWDDILSFRSEEASQQQLRALRLWVSDMAKGKLTVAEAVDKIEYLKQEYRAYMKGATITMGTSVLRTAIVGAAGFIENIAKFKLKELAEAPFKLFEAKTALLEAERKAPGR